MFAYQENYLNHHIPCSPVTEEGSNNSHRDFQIREQQREPSHSHRVVGWWCWPQQCPLSQRMLTEGSPAAVKVLASDSPPLRPNWPLTSQPAPTGAGTLGGVCLSFLPLGYTKPAPSWIHSWSLPCSACFPHSPQPETHTPQIT